MAELTAYATAEQYDAYPVAGSGDRGLTAVEIGGLLWRASRDVDRITLTAVYDPTDEDIARALMQATCEQADWRIAQGQESGIGAGGVHSVSIATVQISRGYTGSGSAAMRDMFSPQAYTILQLAGLISNAPWTGA